MEIPEAYIGQNQKLRARVIIHRLTDTQTQTRLKNQAVREKKKGTIMKDKSKRLMGMNVYMTNTSLEEVSSEIGKGTSFSVLLPLAESSLP